MLALCSWLSWLVLGINGLSICSFYSRRGFSRSIMPCTVIVMLSIICTHTSACKSE